MTEICIIVGHGKGKTGGYDPGAVSGNYHEFKIAREIAKYAQAYYNDNYIEQADLLNYEGDLYLTERIKAVNAADYDFVAEIHLNAGGGTGTECYYSAGNSKGKQYAAAINDAVRDALGVAGRGAKTKLGSGGKDYFAIIRETKPTAVLIETVFIDTVSDLAKVNTPDGQAACGAAIAEAVAKVRVAKRKTVSAGKPTGSLYRVQVGAFRERENAEAMLQKIKDAGFADAFIKSE